MKVKRTSGIMAVWYFLLLVMTFAAPASGVLIIITAIVQWAWSGPLKKNGITWTVKK